MRGNRPANTKAERAGFPAVPFGKTPVRAGFPESEFAQAEFFLLLILGFSLSKFRHKISFPTSDLSEMPYILHLTLPPVYTGMSPRKVSLRWPFMILLSPEPFQLLSVRIMPSDGLRLAGFLRLGISVRLPILQCQTGNSVFVFLYQTLIVFPASLYRVRLAERTLAAWVF